MRNLPKKLRPLAAILALGLGACAANVGVFPVISTNKESVTGTPAPGKVEGEACAIFSIASLQEAVDNALRKAGGDYDALSHTMVEHKIIPFVKNCFTVKGTPIKTGAAPAAGGGN